MRHSAAPLTSFGGHSGGGTPLPIPNRAVKPASADGTRRATSRESRSPPIFFAADARLHAWHRLTHEPVPLHSGDVFRVHLGPPTLRGVQEATAAATTAGPEVREILELGTGTGETARRVL